MFFELSKNPNYSYSKIYKIGNYIMSTDDGWHEVYKDNKKAIVKGYCLEVPIEQAAFEIPKYRGMFCSVAETDLGILVTHGIFRGFYLFEINDGVSNFDDGKLIPYHCFWQNNVIKHYDTQNFTLQNINSLDEAISLIDSYIEENVKQFSLLHKGDIIATITGGLDTTLVYSYLESLGIPNTPVIDIHFEFNQFIVDNAVKLGKFADWIKLINHYRNPTVVTTGANGDWLFLRIPDVMSAIDINNTYTYEEDDYVDLRYNKLKNLTEITDSLNTIASIIHLGNTIYFNPLMDMRIPLTLFKVNRDELIPAVKKGIIQKKLIAKRCPWLENLLPNKKELDPFDYPSSRKNFLSKILEMKKT